MAIADIDARDNARKLAASFDLTKLPPDFYADPYPYYRALREHEPVKRMPDGSWFLTRYDDIVPVYRDSKLFSSDKKKEFGAKYGATPLFEHHTTSLIFNDPPLRTRVRRAIVGAKKAWVFKTPQTDVMMAGANLEHMAKNNVKTLGYVGFNDALGEAFFAEIDNAAAARHARRWSKPGDWK